MCYNRCIVTAPRSRRLKPHFTQEGNIKMASHPIVHVEIPAIEPKTTGEFYARVFDWKLELDPNFNYLQFDAQGGPGGAFVKIGDSITENGPMKHKANSPL